MSSTMGELQRLLFLQVRKSPCPRQTLQDRRSHPSLPTHSGEMTFRILYCNCYRGIFVGGECFSCLISLVCFSLLCTLSAFPVVCFLLGLDGSFPPFIDLDSTIDDTTRTNQAVFASLQRACREESEHQQCPGSLFSLSSTEYAL